MAQLTPQLLAEAKVCATSQAAAAAQAAIAAAALARQIAGAISSPTGALAREAQILITDAEVAAAHLAYDAAQAAALEAALIVIQNLPIGAPFVCPVPTPIL